MIWALKWLTKRPTDTQIRMGNIVFWGILICIIAYNLFYLQKPLQENFFWVNVGNNVMFIKLLCLALGFIPLSMWLWNICFVRAKYMRILQAFIGVFLMYISYKIPESPILDFDTLLFILWCIALVAGILGKAITKTCLRYGEKVQKIRV